MKIAFILLLVSSAKCAFAQQHVKWSSLVGKYYFHNDDSTLLYFIRLDSNKSYYFSISNDLIEKKSTGKWELFRDTLFLTSKYQNDNIGIQATENAGPGSEVEVSGIRNLKGQLFPTALVFINGDTTKLCDPLAGDCKFSRGSIQSINVIVGKATSSTYKVKNQRATKFSLVLIVDSYLDNYLFLQRDKFLIQKNLLYPLNNNKMDSIITKANVNVPIALVKQ